jgi:hypothetical protein
MRLVRARELYRARPEDDVGFRPIAFSDPPTARRSLAAGAVVREPGRARILPRGFYREAGGEG